MMIGLKKNVEFSVCSWSERYYKDHGIFTVGVA
jgi:hypothetical protein